MESNQLKTVAQVSAFVKKHVQVYQNFPSKKDIVLTELNKVFNVDDSDVWQIIISEGRFLPSFKAAVGKRKRKTLLKLSKSFSPGTFPSVDFDIE